MRARSAVFVTSASEPTGFPPPDLPEVAFAGRSNVGKSSLINTLVGVPGLARTSQTPGRTRLLNWFRVESARGQPVAFVDLPGYGFAKVGRDLRAAWRPLVEGYLAGGREVLRAVVVLIDARRGAEPDDAELLEYLGEHGLPAIVVLTKSDKLGKAQRKPAALAARRTLGLAREPILFSATEAAGVDELWRAIVTLAGPAAVP